VTTNQEHVSLESLSDLMDGLLDTRAANAIERHLAQCGACSATRDSLSELLMAARDLPRSVLPDQDIWPDLKRTLNERKTLVLPSANGSTSGSADRKVPRISFKFGVLLAIAAVVLIVVSSSITALVLRGGKSKDIANKEDMLPVPLRNVSNVLPPSFRQAETEYNRTIDELIQAVNTQRSQLSPETIRTVDHSLTVVDSAIAEARAALLADPNNRTLVDLLSASYQRKLDLLRRTSELGSRL